MALFISQQRKGVLDMNKLPEKLTQLRKYNGFSQQTVAEKAQVSVLDYMAWELSLIHI